jgi:hypothetical protein
MNRGTKVWENFYLSDKNICFYWPRRCASCFFGATLKKKKKKKERKKTCWFISKMLNVWYYDRW